jgi:hypothetical protein
MSRTTAISNSAHSELSLLRTNINVQRAKRTLTDKNAQQLLDSANRIQIQLDILETRATKLEETLQEARAWILKDPLAYDLARSTLAKINALLPPPLQQTQTEQIS